MTVQEKQENELLLLFTFTRLPWSWDELSGLQHDTLSWHSFGLRDEARSLFFFSCFLAALHVATHKVLWLRPVWWKSPSCECGSEGGRCWGCGFRVLQMF